MGEKPDWYDHLRASRYLGVAPWDLLEQPIAWRNWALMSEQAEMAARKQKEDSASRKSKK